MVTRYFIVFSLLYSLLSSPLTRAESLSVYEVLHHIDHFYVNEVDKNALTVKAVNSIIKELDPYSEYLDGQSLKALFDSTNGKYTGLGIEVEQRESHIIILATMPNSPAERAGLRKGDVLLAVNGTKVINESVRFSSELIRNAEQATLAITVARANEPQSLTFMVERDEIALKSVAAEYLGNQIGYLRIVSFNNNTYTEAVSGINFLVTEFGIKKLLIDLRDNPGGTLSSAVAMADLFLEQGDIVSTKGRFTSANQVYRASQGDIMTGAPIVVLINGRSASASEILAGALKDNARATIVGTQSYGKGSVQSLIPLNGGEAALKLTTAKYYTPAGTSIDGIGITPDIKIEQAALSQSNKDAIMDLSLDKQLPTGITQIIDTQLAHAQALLEK